jgi:UDP-N-acetylmuramoyl-tripeptide--D-alanyl-D-alanine ligase
MVSMMAMQLSEAAEVLHGRLAGENVTFRGVSTDTRKLIPGSLYIALQGPNFDGHAFVENARQQGAAAAAVSKPCDSLLPQVKVVDTRLGLGQLGAFWRQQFSLPVVAITGSNGKTTVRAMTEAILSACGRTLSTQGNLNNDIGLPLMLARLSSDDQYAVLEMGANHPGEIDYLAGLAQPTIAVITNAAPAHLQGFGDLEGVAKAKGELFARLDNRGTAVINADDDFAPLWRSLASHCRIVEFGLDSDAGVTCEWEGDTRGSDIRLETTQGELELRLPLPGRHNVMNALAACAVSQAAGADLAAVKRGLESLSAVAGRFNIHSLPGGITLVDDTYNANPESLQAALDVLAMSVDERWLVLGDMGELGAGAAELHSAAGRMARAAGVSRLYGLGELARAAVASFDGPGGAFPALEELLVALRKDLAGPLHILVKGSRRMRMERVVSALGVKPNAGEMH